MECAVGKVYGVWSVGCGVLSVVWSVECGVRSVQCKV